MNLSAIWETILKTNTFNFIIFLGIIIFVAAKINLPKMIFSLQEKIEKKVTDATTAKKDSEINYKNAESKLENIDNEIEDIISEAKKTAENLKERINEKALAQIEIIEKNTQKMLDNETYKLRKSLSDTTSKASLVLVENNLKRNLETNPALHQSFIDEAIDKIETLEI